MKISKPTANILKNFATINNNLLVREGRSLKTMSVQKNIVASTSVPEQFPQDFGIYDLQEFLSVVDLFEDPEFDFNDKFVTIKEGKKKIKYFAASESVLVFPTKDIVMPSEDVAFTLTAGSLQTVLKAASVLSAEDLTLVGEGGTISIKVHDKKNPTANSFDMDLEVPTEDTFTVNLKISYLKMMPDDYEVVLCKKRISRFKAIKSDLTYFIAMETDSSFD